MERNLFMNSVLPCWDSVGEEFKIKLAHMMHIKVAFLKK